MPLRLRVFPRDCLEILPRLQPESVDAIVTDPPYGLEFMGKDWDRFAGSLTDRDFKGFVLSQQRTRNVKCPDCGKWVYDHPGRLCECGGVRRAQGSVYQQWCQQWAAECLRVAKPGAYLLAFGGTRTYHRLACAIEDAGWEIRDSLHWIYGSGFPKSLDVSKAIDKAAGAEREVIGKHPAPAGNRPGTGSLMMSITGMPESADLTAPATEDAVRWDGWGTAMKPAHEPIVVARKPLAGTVAANVLAHGTGALNINGCRVGTTKDVPASPRRAAQGPAFGELGNDPGTGSGWDQNTGRWPPNILLTHAAGCQPAGAREVRLNGSGMASARSGGFGGGLFGDGSPDNVGGGHTAGGRETVQAWDCAPGCPVAEMDRVPGAFHADSGGASRFFPQFTWDEVADIPFLYQAKAGRKERPAVEINGKPVSHPTVKPLALMRWLVRLVTPPDGVVLDPFAGTGTTGQAALDEGFRAILCEDKDDDEHPYLRMIRKRLELYGDWAVAP